MTSLGYVNVKLGVVIFKYKEGVAILKYEKCVDCTKFANRTWPL